VFLALDMLRPDGRYDGYFAYFTLMVLGEEGSHFLSILRKYFGSKTPFALPGLKMTPFADL
jgi:hypothetical protein